MQFQVPQFIETEDKIVGPFTLKQFFWVAAGVAVMFIIFLTLGINWFFLLAIPVMGLFSLLAFYKVEGVSLPLYLLRGMGFVLGSKQYLYKPEQKDAVERFTAPANFNGKK